jgi:GDPmannose 4,6-dehydratase
MKKAFITGISGQDGSYLSELLLKKNYKVYGILRRSSVFTSSRIDHLDSNSNFKTFYGDLGDSSNLHKLITKIKPDEVYNLGAQSHVAVSFSVPEYTSDVDALGAIRILNAIRDLKNECKYYQASTSELFSGFKNTLPQDENTPFYPRSPYATAKLFAYWTTVNYREAYGMFASNGILFNHESPRRGETFVSKKITKAVANIYKKKQKNILLGNLDAARDWGHAKDYVYAQWLILQQKTPSDFVISTGKSFTVRQFVEVAFRCIDIEIKWIGKGINEKGIDKKTGNLLVKVDKKYFRPLDVMHLEGNPKKAQKILNWKPKISFFKLVESMVDYDLKNENYGGKELI